MSGDFFSGSSNRSLSRSLRGLVVGPLLIAFCCGVILLYRLSVLPAWQLLFAAMAGCGVLALLLPDRWGRTAFILLAALLAGTAWASWHSSQRLHERLPAAWERVPLEVSGYVCSLPARGSFNSLKFDFCLVENAYQHSVQAPSPAHSLPSRLRLAWYGDHPDQLPGHTLTITVVLKRPHGGLNLTGFRYEDWLFRHGYRATGSVRTVVPDASIECGLHCRYRYQHRRLLNWVTAKFGEATHFPLLASLLIGYRGAMTPAHWDTLKATGTIHLVAISGLHLGLVALGIGCVARRCAVRVPESILSERARRRLVFGVVMIGCLAYALMSGFTVPTRRALLMIAVLGWSLLQGWHIPPWRSLLLALTVVLIADPFSPLDAGFWLSFCAVAVLILVFSGRLGAVQGVLALVLAQTAMFAGLWPGLLLLGQNQPLAGFVANLFAIPWVSMVVMPLLLCGALLVALVPASSVWVTLLLDTVLGVLWQGLQWLAGWNSPTIQLGVAAAIGLAAVVLLALWYPQRGFRLALAVCLGLWLVSHVWFQAPVDNRPVPMPQVIVWDVGQGLSVLVRHQKQALLYDTGPAIPGVFSAVESVILPNLRALGVQRLDTLVVSHADGDHSGGLEQLVTELPLARLIGGEAAETAGRLGQAGLVRKVTDCRRQTLMLGRLELNFWRSDRAKEGNGASCVLRIRDPDSATEWLLTGDITVREEAEYLSYLNDQSAQKTQKARNAINRVLLAPHHGSKTSSSDVLIQALSPDTVIYTAGYRHRYGHPHPQVTRRYELAGSHQINTACAGAVIMGVKSDGLVIRQVQQSAPFWISGPGLARARCLERLRNVTQ